MGLTTGARADLVFAGIVGPSSDPAEQAAILENHFNTGPLVFLGLYQRNDATGAVTFVTGAIADMSQISFSPAGAHDGLVSWDLTGTDFRMSFVLAQVVGSDYNVAPAFSVTPDQEIRSFGLQPSQDAFVFGGEYLYQVSFFGSRSTVPDAGSTALLLAGAMASLPLLRRTFTRCPQQGPHRHDESFPE